MKKILVATDFSLPAENAAHYAISLAKALQLDVTLFNAYKVPSEMPLAAQVAWPLIEESDLELEAGSKMNELVNKLDLAACSSKNTFCPSINFEYEKGEVGRTISSMVKRTKADFVVMGMAGAGQFIQWALGSNTKTMIDEADFPVLYVPYVAKFKKIKKIAFTTNLLLDDLVPLQLLCKMAASLDAEILVYHISNADAKGKEEERIGYDFFERVIAKLDYRQIKFEIIWRANIEEGFRWIRNNPNIDLIAMVHRQHSLLDKLVNGSHAHKLSRFTSVPLLVFQPQEKNYRS